MQARYKIAFTYSIRARGKYDVRLGFFGRIEENPRRFTKKQLFIKIV
jgi:hypothetical protein